MQAFLKAGKSANGTTEKQASNAPTERRKPPAPWVEK